MLSNNNNVKVMTVRNWTQILCTCLQYVDISTGNVYSTLSILYTDEKRRYE